MAAETLNFGPEWLRALSSGGSVTSPPPSPAMPKYKLAEYRYGREEMLALYVKENKAVLRDEIIAWHKKTQEDTSTPLSAAGQPDNMDSQQLVSLVQKAVTAIMTRLHNLAQFEGGESKPYACITCPPIIVLCSVVSSLGSAPVINRRKTEEEEKLLKMLQGMRQQDGFTTWSEQMLHALNSNTSTSNLDVSSIVSYLKEVESPYEVHDFIRSYLGDTLEAKEFAKQFLERRAKQKANHQRQQQQQQLSKEMAGLTMNFPLQDAMRGLNPSSLQAVFQSNHCSSKQAVYESEPSSKMKKKQHLGLHSDPSILGEDSPAERLLALLYSPHQSGF
ncbi:UNVERIFIED_CONTAM: hypothetical protein FKN15_021595 [Acipenser sinensis]